MGEIISLSPRQAFEKCMNGAIMLDIRPEALSLFKGFDVPEILFCPKTEIPVYLDRIPTRHDIIIADSSGNYSREVCLQLANNGFNNIFQLAGGFVEWELEGLPITQDNKSRLSGSCVCQLKYREK